MTRTWPALVALLIATPAQARVGGTFAEAGAIAKQFPNDTVHLVFPGGSKAYKTGRIVREIWAFGTAKPEAEAIAFTTRYVAKGKLVDTYRATTEGPYPTTRLTCIYDDGTTADLDIEHGAVTGVDAYRVPNGINGNTIVRPDGSLVQDCPD
ncbi:MAG: hypothetical protein JWM80_811 [Cyanobacteria bacterium RYN_339]|nr:hypothetical protein [Cyanobacteria bacterium RYN_339]